mgnify:CR=1 FL=1
MSLIVEHTGEEVTRLCVFLVAKRPIQYADFIEAIGKCVPGLKCCSGGQRFQGALTGLFQKVAERVGDHGRRRGFDCAKDFDGLLVKAGIVEIKCNVQRSLRPVAADGPPEHFQRLSLYEDIHTGGQLVHRVVFQCPFDVRLGAIDPPQLPFRQSCVCIGQGMSCSSFNGGF